MTRYGTVDVAIECCFGIVQSVPSGLQFCGIAAAVFVQHASEQCHSPPTLLRPLRLPASPEGSAVTPGTLPTTTILSLSLTEDCGELGRTTRDGCIHRLSLLTI